MTSCGRRKAAPSGRPKATNGRLAGPDRIRIDLADRYRSRAAADPDDVVAQVEVAVRIGSGRVDVTIRSVVLVVPAAVVVLVVASIRRAIPTAICRSTRRTDGVAGVRHRGKIWAE